MPFQRFHALDITSGAERPNSPVVISGFVVGTGQGAVANRIVFDPAIHNQRASLAIASNNVLIAWASHEDNYVYHGWVMSYDKTSLQQTGIVCSTPNGWQGGIWMSGWAPAVDSAGYAYYSVGNGSWDGKRNFGESVIKLSSSERLAITDFFTPYDWAHLNDGDLDLGSTGVMLVPGTTAAVVTGKEGILYLANISRLGWETATNSQIYQSFDLTTLNATALYSKGGPIFWNRPNGTSMLYIEDRTATMFAAFRLLQTGVAPGIPMLDTALADIQRSPFYAPSGGGGLLSLSGDPAGVSAIVWSSTTINQNGSLEYRAERHSSRLRCTRTALPSCGTAKSIRPTIRSGIWAKFVPPVVANGRVYLATFSNQLLVYGTLN